MDENRERIKGADGKYLFNAVKTTDWGAPETLKQWRVNWAKAENGDLSSVLFFYLGKKTEKGYRAETKVKMTAEVLAFVEKYYITKLDDFQSVVTNLYNQVAMLRKEIRELQAEKKGVKEMLRMYQQYKETLPVYKEWHAISSPKKKASFEKAHQGELMRFNMAERVLKKNYPDMRIPVKALKKKAEELASAIKGASSGLAQFPADMIAKYAEDIDFESLLNPDKYLLRQFMLKSYKHVVRASMKRNKSRIYVEIVIAL